MFIDQGVVPLLVDPETHSRAIFKPDVLVDAIVAKRNTGTRIDDAPFVVALGPGFTPRVDCHAVVETNRGHHLGRVWWDRPAESNTGMFGGNSNWRGPVWMPVNAMIIRALLQFYLYYGDNFKVECPTGSGRMMNLFEVAKEIADRLTGIFTRNEHGRRSVYGGTEKFQSDPQWRDHILFYEYFHGDNGAGLGASHQTGWTGLVAKLIQLYGLLDAKRALEVGKQAAFIKGAEGAGVKEVALAER